MTSNVILEQQLRLTFVGLTESEMLSIRSHYVGQQGRFLSFFIPSSLLSGMTTPAYFTPTGYSWIYGSAPQVEDIPCAQRYNVSVELVTVPPEGANINGAEFTISTTFTTVTPMVETIAINLAAGVATAEIQFNLAVTATLEPGAPGGDVEFTASGFDLTVAASIAGGVASVSKVSHSWSSAGESLSLTQRLGYRFTVGASDITCQALGVYMPSSSIVERVRIHRVDTGALIATSDITSSANAWVDASITPVVLSASVQYVISSKSSSGATRNVYRSSSGLTFNEAIGSASYWFGSDDNQPTSSTGNSYAFARFVFT